jgi:hypothetical protein
MSASPPTPTTAVVYRSENLPELAAAVIIQRFLSAVMVNVKSVSELQKASLQAGQVVLLFGSYYKKEELEAICKDRSLERVLVHMYLADAAARDASKSAVGNEDHKDAAPVTVECVDATKTSYAAFSWQTYAPADKRDAMPETLKLMDAKGRSDYTSDARMKPFVEWLYTKGCSAQLVHMALFDPSFDLKQCIADGALFAEKSDSLVQSIGSTAGFYPTNDGLVIAVVDAQRQIELIGEELCRARGADYAVITRFDHKAKQTRYTFYTIRSDRNAVAYARGLGFDAGGTQRISGCVSNTAVPAFLKMLSTGCVPSGPCCFASFHSRCIRTWNRLASSVPCRVAAAVVTSVAMVAVGASIFKRSRSGK